MKKLLLSPTLLLITIAPFSFQSLGQNIYQLQPLSTFSTHGDGSLRPGDPIASNLGSQPLFDNASNQRGMAYDPTLTNLVIVDTHTGPGASDHGVGAIYVLDARTGANLDDGSGGSFVLNTNGMPTIGINQAYPYAPAAVADDGVV